MVHICYEGDCANAPVPQAFSSIRGFRTHLLKRHRDTPEAQTSLGNSRMLKRKRDEEDEEDRRRQELEAQLALEAANREPEIPPVRSMDSTYRNEAKLTLSRSHFLNARLILGFNVPHEFGAFLSVSVTPCQCRRHQSHVP
jgi:hypothetical protein